MNEVIFILIGLLMGGAVGWLLTQSMVASASGQLSAKDEEIKRLEERIVPMNARIDDLNNLLRAEAEKRAAAEEQAKRVDPLEKLNTALRDESTLQKEKLAKLSETIVKEREAFEEKKKILDEAEKKLSDAFKALAADALKSNNEDFAERANTLMTPLKETLTKYEKQIAEIEISRQKAYVSLEEQVKSVLVAEKSLQVETSKLVHALSAPQTRGHWGEITLRRVVELAGMSEHCDFVEQESTQTETGRLRPDMIINLPNDRKIIVDAKAPLKAYLEAVEIPSENERESKLADHARQIRDRVKELSRKQYWDQFSPTPDFVVLFLPGEQFLGAALLKDPGLFDDAFQRKVIIATPATLIALLKSAAYGWRQEALAENAQKISELGKQLYDRIATFTGYMIDLRNKLDGAVSSYNKAMGTFENRILVSARKFKELGATAQDDIPEVQDIERTSRSMIPIGFEVEEKVESSDGAPN